MDEPTNVLLYKWPPKSLHDKNVGGEEAFVCDVIVRHGKDGYVVIRWRDELVLTLSVFLSKLV